jgi:teichuronic acid biosynthesis protein TuaE
LGIGLWEILTGNHLSVSGKFGTITTREGEFMPTTFFHNPNDFATFLGLSFPFIFGWLRYSRGIINKILGFGILTISFYVLLATGSRANIIALILEIFVIFFFLLNLRQKIKLAIIAASIFCLSFLLFSSFTQSLFYQTWSQLDSFNSNWERTVGSTGMRFNLVKNGLYYLINSYGFGVGAGNIESHIADYNPYPTSDLLSMHNWWVEILANYGIFIFAGYLLFYTSLIYNFWIILHRKLETDERMICETLFLSMVGFSLVSVSSSSIMEIAPQWMLFGFALAFLNYYRNQYSRRLLPN